MSLLTQMMEQCKILNHIRQDDEFGGYTDTWTEGATFYAAIAKNGSPEQLVAEQQGLTEQFTVVRISDDSSFRVTSRTQDSTAHPASTIKIAKVTAERWELPS